MKTKLLSIIFAATCLATSSSNATDTPNILAIMVDDLGYGDPPVTALKTYLHLLSMGLSRKALNSTTSMQTAPFVRQVELPLLVADILSWLASRA